MKEELPTYRRFSLTEVQENPKLLSSCGPSALAWLAHEAEDYEPNGDDVTMQNIDSVLDHRSPAETQLFRVEYRRLWSEHAKYKGYDKH